MIQGLRKGRRKSNYELLKFELVWFWKLKKVTMILVVIGPLYTVTDRIETWIKKIGTD